MSSTIRKRRVVSGSEREKNSLKAEQKEDGHVESPQPVRPARTKGGGWRELCIVVAFFFLMLSVALGYLVNRLGVAYLIPRYFKRLSLSSAEAEQEVASHTFLFVGGPHRGGTTILWRCLREHPSISGFKDWVGTDYSEGMFLQSAYPTFGIGREKNTQSSRPRRTQRSMLPGKASSLEGLGAYAFNPDHHLVETHATNEGRTTLMNEWGYLWNRSRPVLLEKSPPNMLISRFLQRLFSTGDIDGFGSECSDGRNPSNHASRAKFLFITRHPIANALALGEFLAEGLGVEGLPDVFGQVLHWVVSHEIMAADMEHLEHSRLIRFEDFVLDPEGYLRDIHDWAGIPGAAEATATGGADGDEEPERTPSPPTFTPPFRLETQVSKDRNRKYEAQYCSALSRSPNLVANHRRLSAKLGERVKAFGYDLDSFPCVRYILRQNMESGGDGQERSGKGDADEIDAR